MRHSFMHLIAGLVSCFAFHSAHAISTIPSSGTCAYLITQPVPLGITNFPFTGTGYNVMGTLTFTSASAGTMSGVFVNVTYKTSDIQVDVEKIKNATGMMACGLFNAGDGYPDVQAKSFQYVYVSINSGVASCEFKDVAAGTYAVSVFHDENDNKKLDKNFVGMPLEGYGVSNNIRHMMSAPEFKESSFQVNGEVDKNIKIRMGY